MGLAPYGDPESEQTQKWKTRILDELVDLRSDGSLLMNMKYFNYATGLTMCNDAAFETLFGIPRRPAESEITQPYMNMALAIQLVTEEVVFRMADTAFKMTGCENLVMAGGVALNCVANGKLLRRGPFKNIWIQPAAGDAGGALGAALAVHHITMGKERAPNPAKDSMLGAYLGPAFPERDVTRLMRRYNAPAKTVDKFDELCCEVAERLSQGAAVGWFQGRMEWGPRALGNRSILGDPRRADMKDILTLKIKRRESFRPVGLVLLFPN
jgi:carbamoyltransferase